MTRLVVHALIVALATAAVAATALASERSIRREPELYMAASNLVFLAPVAGVLVALVHLVRRPACVPGLFGGGVYTVAVGAALIAATIVWFQPGAYMDGQAGLFTYLTGAFVLLLGLLLTIASAVALTVGRRPGGRLLGRSLALAALGAAFTVAVLLARGPNGWEPASLARQPTDPRGAPLAPLPFVVLTLAIGATIHELTRPRILEGGQRPQPET